MSSRRSFLPYPEVEVARLRESITSSSTPLRKDAVIVFVCGADPDDPKHTGRRQFLEYAKKQLKRFRFFRAEEEVFDALRRDRKLNLLELEKQLVDYCDCVIILLESYGAIAELGAFSCLPELAEIMLVVNDAQHRGRKSFIAEGPIAEIAERSKGPCIYDDLEKGRIDRCLPEIERRLSRILANRKKSRMRRINLASWEGLRKRPKDRMMLLNDIICAFSPVRHSELVEIYKGIYRHEQPRIGAKDVSYDEIKHERAMLIAVGLVEAHTLNGHELFVSVHEDGDRFLDFPGINPVALRASIINRYHKYQRDRLALLVDRR